MRVDVPWLPFGIKAITLWPIILYKEWAPCIEVHEKYHWAQALRWGVLPWYVVYLALMVVYIGRPANRHPLERRAYALQWECEGRTHVKPL